MAKIKVKYYCDKCAKKYGWEIGGWGLDTKCSVCKNYAECSEFSSPKEVEKK